MQSTQRGIGKWLRELRKQQSRERIGKSISRHSGHYKSYENEGILPNLKVLTELMKVHGVSVEEVLQHYIPTIDYAVPAPGVHKISE